MRSLVMLFPIAGVGLALLAGCAGGNTQVTNVDRIYVQRLNARLAQYNQSAGELDADIKRQFAPAPATTPIGVNSTAQTPNPNLPDEIARDAETHARATMLSRFMQEAATSGQFGLMWSWLQNQAQELDRFTKTTDDKVAVFQKDAAGANPKDPQLPTRFVNLLVERGSERGAGEELLTISNDLQGYQRDYAGAAASDEQRRQDTMRLIAAYLSAPRVNVQASSQISMPTFTTCQPTFIGGMNCMSH